MYPHITQISLQLFGARHPILLLENYLWLLCRDYDLAKNLPRSLQMDIDMIHEASPSLGFQPPDPAPDRLIVSLVSQCFPRMLPAMPSQPKNYHDHPDATPHLAQPDDHDYYPRNVTRYVRRS